MGVLLKNNLYIPISPCGIRPYFLSHIINDKNLDDKLLTYKEHNKLVSEERDIREFVDIKNVLVSNNTNFIIGLLTKKEGIIPLKESELEEKDIEKAKRYDLDINDLIYNTKKSGDLRKREVNKYHNNVREFKNVILAINRFLLHRRNIAIRNEILLIIKNKVYPLNKKRYEIRNIINKHKIFTTLFNFTEMKVKKVIVEDMYSQNKKINISKKNLVNGANNSKLFMDMLIEKTIRSKNEGIKIVTKK